MAQGPLTIVRTIAEPSQRVYVSDPSQPSGPIQSSRCERSAWLIKLDCADPHGLFDRSTATSLDGFPFASAPGKVFTKRDRRSMRVVLDRRQPCKRGTGPN